jgi:ATP-dependent protease Clp ATPase subunit
MMNAADQPLPSPEEIQRKLAEFMKREFGDRVQLAGTPQAETAETGAVTEEKRPHRGVFNFDFKPKDIKAHLDRFIIQQDDAKKVLSIAGLLEELHRLRTELAYWRRL